MKGILRFIIMSILTGIILGFVLSNSVNYSIEPILGSVYDHARPEVREKNVNNIRQLCTLLKTYQNTPEAIQIDSSLNKDAMIELCQKDLTDRELFVEFIKLRTGNIKDIINNDQTLGIYSSFLNLAPKDMTTSIIFGLVLLVLLFLVDGNFLISLNRIGKMLLTISLVLFFIFFASRALVRLMNIDTSLLLEVNEGESGVSEINANIMILFPLVLEAIFTEKMVFYAAGMLVSYILISIIVKLISVKNNNTQSSGP